MNSRGGGIDRHGFDAASEQLGETVFELEAFASRRKPAGSQNGDCGFDLALADARLKKRDAHISVPTTLWCEVLASRGLHPALSVYWVESDRKLEVRLRLSSKLGYLCCRNHSPLRIFRILLAGCIVSMKSKS
jgi:hypothetical protein